MNRFVLLGATVVLTFVALAGCLNQFVPEPSLRVPAEILLAAQPIETEGGLVFDKVAVARLDAWVAEHPNLAIATMKPNCGLAGASYCVEAYNQVMFCRHVCGYNYWQLSSGCILAATGEMVSCGQ